MKTYKEIAEATGRVALAARLKAKGFGTPEREEELESQKKEMEERHSKAEAEAAERADNWKKKFGSSTKKDAE